MSVQCQHFNAMRYGTEKIASSSEQSLQFSNSCKEGRYLLPLFSGPPPSLQSLLTGSATLDRRFRQNMRNYNSALSMGTVTAIWVKKGPDSSFFNAIITLQGHTYHYIGDLMPTAHHILAFLYAYILDSNYCAQEHGRTRSMKELNVQLMRHLT